ncbi:MAG: hypothetical protein EZS28_050358, partial [Streblomastix strix]
IGTHFNQELDLQAFALRSSSIKCLWYIQSWGDVSTHSELINVGYARVFVIAISTAGGSGEEQDREIKDVLDNIFDFFSNLNQGNDYNKIHSHHNLFLLIDHMSKLRKKVGMKKQIRNQLIKGINIVISNIAQMKPNK